MDKVSCVMTTYGRFTCVERSLAMFLHQDYEGPTELIIFNTASDHPYTLEHENPRVKIINNGIDYQTGQPYNNVGSIRRDALTHATGDWYICWDDDDIFLPWNIRMCIDSVKRTGKKAWKPQKSFFASQNYIKLVQNTLEASVIAKLEEVRNLGFYLETGKEHLLWYTELRNQGELNENDPYYLPGYCFNWGDTTPIARHKQSGKIGDPNNFEEHKQQSTDFVNRPLKELEFQEIIPIYTVYLQWLQEHRDEFPEDLYIKYIDSYTRLVTAK